MSTEKYEKSTMSVMDELEETEQLPAGAGLELENAMLEYERAKLAHENAQLRRQAELHEATRDRLREQRDAAIARIRRVRDVLDASY